MHVSKNMKLFKPEIVLLVPMVIESIYKKLKESTGILPKKMVAKAAFGGNLKTICSGRGLSSTGDGWGHLPSTVLPFYRGTV